MRDSCNFVDGTTFYACNINLKYFYGKTRT